MSLTRVKNITTNLGISQANPDAEIHVSTARPHLDIEDTASGARAKIGSGYTNTYLATTHGSGEIIFKNNVGSSDFPHSSGTTLMTIGASGDIRASLQPSFMIRGSSGNKGISNGSAVASGMYNPTVLHNVGNHLNTSNAVFTAPVDGRYYMEWIAYTQTTSGSKNQYIGVYLNFSNCGPVYGFHECGPDVCAQISGIFNMSANDTVQPYTYGHSSVTQTYIGQHSYFSGHLLG